ncbi:hypothetical protein [Nocardioides mangrovi]|uniref:Uncharacterized protein n=1 Tax=Nocardioides mangrovi TaxID=2874580 RepID=A0ABS7U877_9ACTN|nr:hypothetical protein [Nocardioides mangrovi]MBZ5737170.1 hypothetical protein [Nocardioides mangrovi]
MRRLIALALTCALVAVAVLRSHPLALALLVALAALAGLLIAIGGRVRSRDVVRLPVAAAVVVTALVGIGQLGLLGLGIGLVLLCLVPSFVPHTGDRR